MCVLWYIFLRGARNVNINPVFVRSHHSQTKEGEVSGGGGKYKKNHSRKGKLNEKIHERQLTPNYIYATA